MIKVFRHIRQRLINKSRFSKYMLYAIGEIILVVIGILIALQINNVNELRKASISEKVTLQKLVQDLRADSLSYARNLYTLKQIRKLHKELYEIGINSKESVLTENPNYIRRLLFYNPITKENDPVIASKISNEEIRNEILVYFRSIKDMEDTYGEFEEVIQQRMRPFLSKKGVHNLSTWFENQNRLVDTNIDKSIISATDLISLSTEIEFQQLLLESSIKCEEAYQALNSMIKQNDKLIKTINLY